MDGTGSESFIMADSPRRLYQKH